MHSNLPNLPSNIDELFQLYLQNLFQGTDGYANYSEQEFNQLANERICVTYGELLYPSVKKILKILKLTEQDVFLDLGSGLGKLALQVFLQSNVNKVIGIEAQVNLHQQGQVFIEKVKQDAPQFWENKRSIELIHGNFLESNWQAASCIYSCSTCFSQELLIAIGNKINIESTVSKVLSLRPLPTLTRLKLKDIFRVNCSWDATLCYYYANL